MTQYQVSTSGPLGYVVMKQIGGLVLQYLVYNIIISFIELLSVVKGRVCVKILSV